MKILRVCSSALHRAFGPRMLALLAALVGCSAVFFLTRPLRQASQSWEVDWYGSLVGEAMRGAAAQPKDPNAWFKLGMAYGQGEHWLEAVESFHEALKLGMDTADLHHYLAAAYAHLEDLTQATKHFKRAIELDPKSLRRYLTLSEWYVKWGKRDEALTVLRFACERTKVLSRVRCVCDGSSLSKAELEETAKLFESLAVDFGQAGDDKKSLEFARHIIHLISNHGAAYAIVGRAYFLLGENEKAISHLKEACRLLPERGEPHYWLATALLKRGSGKDEEEALRHFVETVRLNPTFARAYYEMGRLFSKRKKWKEASLAYFSAYEFGYGLLEPLRLSAEASKKAGDTIDAAFKMGTYYRKLGRFDEAITEFRKLLSEGSTRLQGYKAIAQVYEVKGEHNRCVDALKQAMALDEKDPSIYLGLAEAYKWMNKPKLRHQTLKRLADLLPERADIAYFKLGSDAGEGARWEEAEDYVQKCIRMQPDNPAYYHLLAEIYRYRPSLGNRLQKMIEALEKAIALGKRDFDIYHLLGVAYMKANRLQEAAAAFRRTINLQPGYGEAYMNLAYVYRKLGENKKAVALMEKHRRYRAWLEQLEEAESRLRQSPNDYKLAFQLGLAYLSAGDYFSAARSFRKSVAVKPNYLPAHEKLAEVYKLLAAPSEQARELAILQQLRPKRVAPHPPRPVSPGQ